MSLATFLILAFVVGSAALATLSLRFIAMGWPNPLAAYMVAWSAALLVYQLPWLDLRPLGAGTLAVFLAAAVAFAIGSLATWAWSTRPGQKPGEHRGRPRYNHRRLVICHVAALVALSGYFVLQVVRALPALQAAGGLSAILGGSGIDVRRAYLSSAIEASQTTFSGGSVLVGVLGYALFLGTLSVFWSGYLARRGQYVLAGIPLVLEAIQSLVLLQRAAFIYSLLLFTFSWAYHRDAKRTDVKRTAPFGRVALAATMLVIVPVVVLVPLAIRQPDLSGSQTGQSVLTYPVSGLAGINALLIDDPSLLSAASPVVDASSILPEDPTAQTARAAIPGQGFGAWSFFGLASFLARVGLPVGIPTNYFGYDFIQLADVGQSNTYSYLLYGFYDFGAAGFIVIPMLLGMVATLLHRRVRNNHWSLIPFASVMMTTVVMSPFGFSLPRDLRFAVLLVAAPLIAKWMLRSDAPPEAGLMPEAVRRTRWRRPMSTRPQ